MYKHFPYTCWSNIIFKSIKDFEPPIRTALFIYILVYLFTNSASFFERRYIQY